MSDKQIQPDDCCAREKYWSELNESEKLERMHQVVRQLRHSHEHLLQEIALLRQHGHSDGKMVVPMDTFIDRVNFPTARNNDQYF